MKLSKGVKVMTEKLNVENRPSLTLSQELLELREKYVARGVGNVSNVFVKKAEGATIIDVEGNRFIDFAGAIGCLNVGHSPQKVVDAVKEQLDQYIHTCFHVVMYEPYVRLAQKLAEITPGTFDKKAMFANSGAEAVENAVKIARKYTKRQAVVSFRGGFHGRTLMGMSLTSKVKPYKFDFGPFAPMIYKAPFPYPYRRPINMSEEEYTDYCIHEFEHFFVSEVSLEEVAAMVMEPVQGEGGFVVPPKRFVQAVAKICKDNGIVYIADEIQTGFGRTGTMFASEQQDVEPDIIILSKSIAAGIPISAVVGKQEIMDCANPGELGGTFGGSPLGCVAALEVIDLIDKEQLLERSNYIGSRIKDRMAQLQRKTSIIGDIRGLGAMVAIELVKDENKTPAKEECAFIIKECIKNGLITMGAGVNSNVIRFLPPLVTTNEELEEGLDILEKAILSSPIK